MHGSSVAVVLDIIQTLAHASKILASGGVRHLALLVLDDRSLQRSAVVFAAYSHPIYHAELYSDWLLAVHVTASAVLAQHVCCYGDLHSTLHPSTCHLPPSFWLHIQAAWCARLPSTTGSVG
jgi:hypothetical protein